MRKFLRVSLAIQLCLFALLGSIDAASTKSRSKKKVTKEIKEVNICDYERRDAPLFCYCVNHQGRNDTDVNCVVFNNFEIDDPIWPHFATKVHLEKLTFTVKQDGGMTYVPTEALRRLKSLQVLTMEYAKINEIAEHAFSNLSTIAEINLNHNQIVALRKNAFQDMKNVSLINLDENRIVEVNRDVFVNLPLLRKLYLNRNNITILHDKAFKHLAALQELELNGNQISVITSDSFNGLKSLTRLDLSSNLISMIGDRSFVEMPELRELELDKNQIEYISEKALDGMRHLRKLKLSDNRLVSLEPDFLAGATNIYFLDLRGNALRTMTFDNVKPIVTNLYNSTSYFYLDDNKLICDCKLAWIWGLRNETKNLKLRNSLEELTCFMESNNVTVSQSEEAERKQALEIARNQEQYGSDKSRDTQDADNYMDDVADYDDYDLYDAPPNSASGPKVEVVGGKVGSMKPLFDLKPEDLPCPEPSREDLMASEQPSSRHEHAHMDSAATRFALLSAKMYIYVSLPILGFNLLLSTLHYT